MKNLLLIVSLAIASVSFSQDKSACGNCNEKYLKARTFGSAHAVILKETMYVYYALYTPDKRTCFSQNKVSQEVTSTFEAALSSNYHYKELVVQYNQKYDRDPNNKNTLVGRAVHFTSDSMDVLNPFNENASNRDYKIEFIQLNANLKALFSAYYICD